jgi:hypothetical protein
VPVLADYIGDRTCKEAQEQKAEELFARELWQQRGEELGQSQQAQDGAEKLERERDGALGVKEITQVHSPIQRGESAPSIW